MKKILLVLTLFIFSGFVLKAQVVFSQNFEASLNSMPAGWHQQLNASAPTNGGWLFSNSFPGYFGFIYAPYHTYCAFVDDNDYNYPTTQLNNDTLYTPSINLSAYTRLYISFDVWFVGMYDTNAASNYEQANLCVSTNGGLTWTTCDTIYGNTTNYWRTLTFDISAYAGMSNVMFAFTYTDGGYDDIGEALDNIQIYVPPTYDAGVTTDNLPYLAQVGTSYPIQGILRNYGYDTITSLQLKYRVNGGPIVTNTMNAISFKPLHNRNYNVTPWTPSVTGNNIIKIWTDSINGTHADAVHGNDTITATVIVVDSIQPKAVLMEEFTQASCSPCLYFSPQYDSIIDSVLLFTNSIRYHVNWPARDMMNDVTQPDVGTRVSYYPVTGVPTPYMDGEYYYTLSYAGLHKEANLGSPFKIILTNATYDGATNKYHIDVAVKSYGTMPAGLNLQVALSVDTMKYVNDQSLAEPQSYFEPPIGNTLGGSPDWLYPYALNYPDVVEKMLPNANGTSMAAFTVNQIQNFSFTWTKNRPWADSVHTWVYDSVGTRFTVFIQDNSNQYVYQSAHAIPKNVTGFAELSSNGSDFAVYPNPANNFAVVLLKLSDEQNVSIEIYNMLGDKVYSMDAGNTQAGMHNYKLNTAEFSAGVYFVKVITNGSTQVKKLEIVR